MFLHLNDSNSGKNQVLLLHFFLHLIFHPWELFSLKMNRSKQAADDVNLVLEILEFGRKLTSSRSNRMGGGKVKREHLIYGLQFFKLIKNE